MFIYNLQKFGKRQIYEIYSHTLSRQFNQKNKYGQRVNFEVSEHEKRDIRDLNEKFLINVCIQHKQAQMMLREEIDSKRSLFRKNLFEVSFTTCKNR